MIALFRARPWALLHARCRRSWRSARVRCAGARARHGGPWQTAVQYHAVRAGPVLRSASCCSGGAQPACHRRVAACRRHHAVLGNSTRWRWSGVRAGGDHAHWGRRVPVGGLCSPGLLAFGASTCPESDWITSSSFPRRRGPSVAFEFSCTAKTSRRSCLRRNDNQHRC